MNKPNGPMPTSNLGAQTSIQPDTPIPDWITLHPKVTHTAYRLYAMMRALYLAGDGDPLTITQQQLADMFPGKDGGRSSLTPVQNALKALSEIGLIYDPDPEYEGLRVTRRYAFNESAELKSQADEGIVKRPSMVYLIGSPSLAAVKIGITRNIPERFSSLQRASAHHLEMLWSTPGGRDLERWLHEQFRDLRTHGEWFDFGAQDPVATVANMAKKYKGGAR